jgi:hypothetical protein
MRTIIAIAVAVGAVAVSVHAAGDEQTLVVCSPGSPGSTEEAQPRMDALGAVLSSKSGSTVTAVYDPSDSGGAKRLASAGIGIVSLPFFLQHEKELGLHARLQVVQKGRPALEKWTLVAQKGTVKGVEGLGGYTVMSNAGFAPGFVKAAIGELPASAKIVKSTQVLSGLRKAANGEQVAVLLDGPSAASLASLPFADKLEVVTTSGAWPAGIVATIDARISNAKWAPIQAALTGLASDHAGATALDGLQMERFAPLDDAALAAARKAFAKGAQ